MADDWREHVLGSLPTMQATTEPTAGFTPPTAADGPVNFGGFHAAPSFDMIELLPERAQDRLRALRQRSDDLHAIIPPFAELQEATTARTEAENRLRKLQAHPQDHGFNLREDDPRVIEQKKLVAKLAADLKRLQERSEARSTAWQSTSQAKTAVEAWLKHGVPSGVQLLDHDGEVPKLAKNESITDAVERLRRRCRELKADLHRIASSPYPSSYAKALLREAIETLAERGTPDVSTFIEHGERGSIIWPMLRVRSEVHGAQRQLAFREAVDVVGLFACLLKPAMISFLDALVDAEKDDPVALSYEQRQQAEAETMGDLLDVERQEAHWVWEAQAQNLPCEHRSDISPLALLGLKLITVPRAPDGPSLPERAGYNLIGGR